MLVLPATAHAATLTAGKSCYPNGDDARLVGRGYTPESNITFTVNSRTLKQQVQSAADGTLEVDYSPRKTSTERKLVIRATDQDGHTGRETIFVTARFHVTAHPASSKNVEKWKAVFGLFGFGHGKAYIHYVNPKGHFKKTVKLGRLHGPCGRLTTTKRRVMPFRDPQYGPWQLQFDTHRRYRKNIDRKQVLHVTVY